MKRLPLTLVGGGPESARLVGQLIDPPEACLVIGSTRALTQAQIPVAVGLSLDTGPSSIAEGSPQVHLATRIRGAVERSPSAKRLIVTLDQIDDVAAVALTVLSDEAVRGLVRLDGIVATVDAVQMSTRLMAEQPADTPDGLDRLAIADRILVARSCDVTPSALTTVAHLLRSINQTGPIIAPAIAQCSLEDLLDLDAWSGSPAIGPRPAYASPFLGPDAPSMVVCRTAQPLDPEALDRWLDQVLTDHAGRLLRLLGTISSATDRRRTYLHGIRSCLLRSRGSVGHRPDRDGPSIVALIGRGLPADGLQRSFSACRR